MRRAVLDSGAYDTLIDVEGAYEAALEAVRAARLEVLYTQINVDELAATPSLDRRRLLLFAMVSLGEYVTTAAFALGYDRRLDGSDLRGARLDTARLSADDDVVLFEALRKGDHVRDTNDALIAATARGEDCVLVIRENGDTTLGDRAGEEGIEVLTVLQLLAEMGFHTERGAL